MQYRITSDGSRTPVVLDTVTASLHAAAALVARPGSRRPATAARSPFPAGWAGATSARCTWLSGTGRAVHQRRPAAPCRAGATGGRRHPGTAAAGSLERERDRVLTAAHADRHRIRRDLHDGLGPSLARIGSDLQAAQAQLRERADPSRHRPAPPARLRSLE
ncbi:histidine kinase [Geodermatophilus maliterrae]|uniref:Histidine kinase n=1 Tax=Geodermatophilus maliterrae TaxID=3162531 RepID=A0ABV3XK84_9ACTN